MFLTAGLLFFSHKPYLCDPMEGSLPGFSVRGIFQARTLEWSGLPFPSPVHESESENEVAQSCPTLSNPMDCSPPGCSVHGNSLKYAKQTLLSYVTILLINALACHIIYFGSVVQSCPTLCNVMDCSIPDFPVLHYLLEFA